MLTAMVAGGGQTSTLALAPIVARPTAAMHRATVFRMDAAQDKEIKELKAKLKAAEATITKLRSSAPARPWHASVVGMDVGEQEVLENSRFPMFRQLQSSVSRSYIDYIDDKKKDEERPSVQQLFTKYDADRSGLIDIDEFRDMVWELGLPVDLSVPDFGSMAGDAAKSAETFASGLAKDTAKAASGLAKDTAKAASGLAKGVNDLAASAGVPGATASVPVTLVGGLGSGYKEILSGTSLVGGRDVPVEPLIRAIERQATLTNQLGGFMQLIVKLDEGNMRTVRTSWEAHGKPSTLRALLEAEVAEGVVEPARLREGSAALSLLWSMRAKRFWTTVADGFADHENSESSSAFGIRAYAAELEPYHGFIFKRTFRTALRALPSRAEMLGNMALTPSASMGLDTRWQGWEDSAAAGEDLTPDERMAACLVELRECSEATKRVTNMVQAQLDELGLRDDRKL